MDKMLYKLKNILVDCLVQLYVSPYVNMTIKDANGYIVKKDKKDKNDRNNKKHR